MNDKQSVIHLCQQDMFTKESELREKYPDRTVLKLLRVREMYNWFISNPDASDREFVSEVCGRHGIHKTTAYSDLAVVKTLLPMLGTTARDFHRWRANEMLIETYKMAKRRKDTKTMERAATSYAKMNRIDIDDEQALPYDKIVPQPFTATDDPRVLGIEPIPDIQKKISGMIQKYRAETIDIEDVEFEEADLEFDSLFPDNQQCNQADEQQESLL